MISSRQGLFPKVLIDNKMEPDIIASSLNAMQLPDVGIFVVKEYHVGRPDLIAYASVGDVRLWWLLLFHNDIIDPDEEIVVGTELKIPDLSAYYTFYNREGDGR